MMGGSGAHRQGCAEKGGGGTHSAVLSLALGRGVHFSESKGELKGPLGGLCCCFVRMWLARDLNKNFTNNSGTGQN